MWVTRWLLPLMVAVVVGLVTLVTGLWLIDIPPGDRVDIVEPLAAALVGGLLAAGGSISAIWMTQRHAKDQATVDAEIAILEELLALLPDYMKQCIEDSVQAYFNGRQAIGPDFTLIRSTYIARQLDGLTRKSVFFGRHGMSALALRQLQSRMLKVSPDLPTPEWLDMVQQMTDQTTTLTLAVADDIRLLRTHPDAAEYVREWVRNPMPFKPVNAEVIPAGHTEQAGAE